MMTAKWQTFLDVMIFCKYISFIVTDLAKQLKKDSGNTEIVISSLVVRTDGWNLQRM
jgi:hypothetical protein